jgi:hypothetical protein
VCVEGGDGGEIIVELVAAPVEDRPDNSSMAAIQKVGVERALGTCREDIETLPMENEMIVARSCT